MRRLSFQNTRYYKLISNTTGVGEWGRNPRCQLVEAPELAPDPTESTPWQEKQAHGAEAAATKEYFFEYR